MSLLTHRHGKIKAVRGPNDRHGRWRIAHLTTADISLALLLSTELSEGIKHGHDVIGISAPGPYVERVEALGVKHVAVSSLTRSWGLGQDLRAFYALWRTLRSLDLDVLHTHNPKTGVMGRIAGRLAGVPVVVNTCHGLWATPEDSLAKRAFVYGLEGLAARFSDYELFQNAQDERTLRRFLKPGRHKVVGNGIDLERFRFDPVGRARLRADWGIDDDETLVGTVGRRVREKGLAEYAVVAQALGDSARFVWVGPADETDAEAAVDLDLSAVTFIPEQSDMPAVYSAFDIFVLASYREGFSRASMEAAACGRPMVLSDIRGCREIGQDGTHLLLVPPRDSSALAAAADRLVADPSLRARLGAAAMSRADAEFDQREVARRSRTAYDDVARWKRLGHLRSDHRTLILHIVPADLNRGAQVYARELRDTLTDDPEQRHLVVSLFDAPQVGMRADRELQTPSRLLRRAGLDPRAVLRLRRLVRRERPAALVAHGGESLKYAVAAAGGTPTIYYKVGLSSTELSRPSRRFLYRALAAKSSHVVAVSGAVAKQCREVLRVPTRKLSVIPNSRDPHLYTRGVSEDKARPPLLLWVGQFEEGKRPALFLDVMQSLRQRGAHFEASMVGDGPLRQPLRARAAGIGVSLLGVRSDVPSLMRQASALVVTSAPDTEGMPGVLIEAGLSGLPVVAMLAAGVDDVISDKQTGYIVEDGDVRVMTARLNALLGDEELACRIGREARRRCSEKFSVDAAAMLWRTVVTQIAPSQAEVREPEGVNA